MVAKPTDPKSKFSTFEHKKQKRCCAPDELDTTPPLRGCRGYATRNRLNFRVSLFTPIVYRLNFLIFWFTNHVYPLSFNGLHVNNSVEILKTRLKTCLCALLLSGLPFKSNLPPVPANAERKERAHFISKSVLILRASR